MFVMRFLTLFVVSAIGLFTIAQAQDAEQLKKKRKEYDPMRYRVSLDTTPHRYFKINPDSLLKRPAEQHAGMPIVDLGGPYIYTMPIKKLSGKGSVRMPGTEPLDKEGFKLDSLRKTFPLKH